MTLQPLKVLSLQPWHGGSHRQFADGWAKRSCHEWTTLGLPGQNWKWRMRYAAIEFARRIEQIQPRGFSWDIVLCTDLMNAAELKALCGRTAGLPTVVYFHENQFAYPNRGKQQPDHHFLFTNMVSALVADEVWFNSRFNRDTFFGGLQSQNFDWADFPASDEVDSIAAKTRIFPPPISTCDRSTLRSLLCKRKERIESGKPLHLVWAARWEYDKNPDALLECLELLAQQRVPFELSVIGENPDNTPAAFQEIHRKFEASIVNWGYQENRKDYWSVLNSADVILSTATHEFFGLSVAEAISVGTWPLLPDRLSYPELIGVNHDLRRKHLFMYQFNAKQLASRIRKLHQDRDWDWQAVETVSQHVRENFSFATCVPKMDLRLQEVVSDFSND